MKLKSLCLLLMASATLFALDFVKDGKSDYVIVIKPQAPQHSVFCAKELQTYVKKVTGVELQIADSVKDGQKAIFIGGHNALPKDDKYNPASYDGQDERFLISELPGGNISIIGADNNEKPILHRGNQGLLWGTYEFIERFLGVRWYAPGDFGECYETMQNVSVTGLPIAITPPVIDRYYWPNFAQGFTNDENNMYACHLRGFGTFRMGANHSMEELALFARDKDEIFALEPDMKTRNKGELRADSTPQKHQWTRYPQYCLTNPATFKAYCDFIDACYENKPGNELWINRRPNEHFIYVVPCDNYTTQPCYCKDCQELINQGNKTKLRKGQTTPIVWGFVKKVAEWAKIKYPDKKILTLAYEGYYEPPEFELPDNVCVQICFNPYIIYQGCPAFREASNEIVEKWSKKVDTISVWHYIMPYDTHPYAEPHVMFNWFREFPKVKSVFLEMNNSRTGMTHLPPSKTTNVIYDMPQTHLNLYFAMRSMAGCLDNVDAELERYYKLFYGPAAVPMKKFYDVSINAWEHVKNTAGGDSSYPKFTGKEMFEQIYTPEIIKIMKDSFAEAKKLAPAGSVYEKRLDWHYNGYFKPFCENADAYAAELNKNHDIVLFPTTEEPVLDGKLDEAFWSQIEPQPFKRIDAPLNAKYETQVRIGASKDKLFIGVVASDPHAADQRATVTIHDGDVWAEDSIEVFIRPGDATNKKFINVSFGLLGTILDYTAGVGKTDRNYESGAQVAILRGTDSYTMEIAIPFEKLDLPEDGKFGLNVCRNKMSGVGEVHERSAWSCPYGSFWNLKNIPIVTLAWKSGAFFEDFTNGNKHNQNIRSMPNDKTGPVLTTGFRSEEKDGYISLYYKFDESNFRYDYGSFTVAGLPKNGALNGERKIELRFRNPDEKLNHKVVWSCSDTEGKKHSGWMRFCTNEKHTDWRTRTIDIVTDSVAAQNALTKGEKVDFTPANIDMIQIYSSTSDRTGKEYHIDLDYIRMVK